MVAAKYGKPFIEGMGDQVAVVPGGLAEPVAEGSQLDRAAHAARPEIAQKVLGGLSRGHRVPEGETVLSAASRPGEPAGLRVGTAGQGQR